mmetsp:Transcript_10455/g.22066  ORF Transcript_10455/g.22066 Transcript_10455/m.22066 type:complete len:213 (-) Transcript_10455:524-1162(-)
MRSVECSPLSPFCCSSSSSSSSSCTLRPERARPGALAFSSFSDFFCPGTSFCIRVTSSVISFLLAVPLMMPFFAVASACANPVLLSSTYVTPFSNKGRMHSANCSSNLFFSLTALSSFTRNASVSAFDSVYFLSTALESSNAFSSFGVFSLISSMICFNCPDSNSGGFFFSVGISISGKTSSYIELFFFNALISARASLTSARASFSKLSSS